MVQAAIHAPAPPTLKGKGKAISTLTLSTNPPKSLYTPVFYRSSPPSQPLVNDAVASSSSKPTTKAIAGTSLKPDPKSRSKFKSKTSTTRRTPPDPGIDLDLPPSALQHLKRLSRMHLALARMEEVPASPRASSPVSTSSISSGSVLADPHGGRLTKIKSSIPEEEDLEYLNPNNIPNPNLEPAEEPVPDPALTTGLPPSLASNPRILRLRRHLSSALEKADYNPSSGKWAVVKELLHIGVTSGGTRWVGAGVYGGVNAWKAKNHGGKGEIERTPRRAKGTRTREGKEREGANDRLPWCNANTEAEWLEWEKQFEEEKRVNRKVEEWKRKLELEAEADQELHSNAGAGAEAGLENEILEEIIDDGAPAHLPTSPPVSVPSPTKAVSPITTKTKQITKATQSVKITKMGAEDPLKDHAPFGFAVTKRAGQTSVAITGGKPKGKPNPKPKGDPSRKSGGDGGGVVPIPTAGHREQRTEEQAEPDTTSSKTKKSIHDLPDTSAFLPPSFPSSQLVTSTPKSKTQHYVNPNINVNPAATANVDSNFDAKGVAPPPSSSPLPILSSSQPQPQPLRSSPSVTRVYGRSGASPRTPAGSSSLPPLPPVSPSPSPLKAVRSVNLGDSLRGTGKRRFSLVDLDPRNARPGGPGGGGVTENKDGKWWDTERQAKKPRLLDTPESPAPAPTTPFPKRQTLPTLTELLASAKMQKAKAGVNVNGRRKRDSLGASVAKAAAANTKSKPGVVDDGVFGARVEDGERKEEERRNPKPSADDSPSGSHPRPHDPPVSPFPLANLGMPVDVTLGLAAMRDPFALDDVDDEIVDDLSSPTKSLSSLAGSDSESDIADDDDDENRIEVHGSFDPEYASTQKYDQLRIVGAEQPGGSRRKLFGAFSQSQSQSQSPLKRGFSSSSAISTGARNTWSNPALVGGNVGLGWGGVYNSQFDVKARVDEVDRLLEKDVDFNGWLKNMSEGEPDSEGADGKKGEEVEVLESP